MDREREQTAQSFGEEVVKVVRFRVQRFRPEEGKAYVQEFQVPVYRGMTVLDGLHYVRDNLDSTLAYRFSCRMGVCGSCGMFINGFPRLACQTQILELGSDTVDVRPMPNYPVVKDLVPDLGPLFEKHRTVRPYVIRDPRELEQPTGEFLQKPEELEEFLQFTYCIKCGLCLTACPTVATDPQYLGPQALAQAYRYCKDTRDAGMDERLKVAAGTEGPWRCHLAGACSEACPKGVDPALGIQLLKRLALLRRWRLKKPHRPAPLAGERTGVSRRPGIPEPPPPTVESEGSASS
ncbi:MAG: succinate dehydrogenase iron-sulfur subunit [candidate division KSB1 bacterium]|nr:succinate dehydrogenase iron-sulfur subunit [candidate division KSB1 bacterium]